MRIVDIRELSVPISRYADPSAPSGGLTTSMVAVITDVITDGKPTIGYGFASIGRFGAGWSHPGAVRPLPAGCWLRATSMSWTNQAQTSTRSARGR